MRGVSVMMIVVVSGVIVVIVVSVMSVVIVMGVMGVMSVMSVFAIMSGVAGGIVSAVTFSYGASCLCRDPRAMGARLWKPYVVCLKPRIAAHC